MKKMTAREKAEIAKKFHDANVLKVIEDADSPITIVGIIEIIGRFKISVQQVVKSLNRLMDIGLVFRHDRIKVNNSVAYLYSNQPKEVVSCNDYDHFPLSECWMSKVYTPPGVIRVIHAPKC